MRNDERDPATVGLDAITTLEELGRYLRELRNKRRVTQEGLTAHTGCKIARSRISEIENARRDPVTERELRIYMIGLKCTSRDIEQVVTVLTRCTTPSPAQSLSHPDVSSPDTTDAHPVGPANVEDDQKPPKQKAEKHPTTSISKRHAGWKFVAVAIISGIIVIIGVALSYTRSQTPRPITSKSGRGAIASPLNSSAPSTQPGAGLGTGIPSPSPLTTQSNPGTGAGLGALNSSPPLTQPNAGLGVGVSGQKAPPSGIQADTGRPNRSSPPTPGNAVIQQLPPTPAATDVQGPSSLPIPGDSSSFISDVTYPDNSSVRVNEQFIKTWEIQNTGSVVWQDRYLTRQTTQDAGRCSSPDRVSIPTTQPDQTVQISVTFTAPSSPGSCRVDWKMTNANGGLFFPNKNPVYLLVNVIQR